MKPERYNGGVLRIKKKNLSKPKQRLHHDALIAAGWIYGEGCGRFTRDPCNCTKCRKKRSK